MVWKLYRTKLFKKNITTQIGVKTQCLTVPVCLSLSLLHPLPLPLPAEGQDVSFHLFKSLKIIYLSVKLYIFLHSISCLGDTKSEDQKDTLARDDLNIR